MIFKIGFRIVLAIAVCFVSAKTKNGYIDDEINLGAGSQPEISVDGVGTVRLVFGLKKQKEKELYFVSSAEGGASFSKPVLLGNFADMGLGMGRGPQIASTKDFTIVTVGDHQGNMYAMRLNRNDNSWSLPVKVNDADTTAKEALSGLGSNLENNEVFTVWLDTRLGNNNLYGASSIDGGLTWNKNQLIFKGKQNGICDCCKPSVSIDKVGNVNVMFRNKLNGARNMYLINSPDGGKHFGPAQKLGVGDYMINACPMDGGNFAVAATGRITSVWRRQTDIYLAKPGQREVLISEGRTPDIAQTKEDRS